jgi:thiol-disulfide isomerase/thioredoxin
MKAMRSRVWLILFVWIIFCSKLAWAERCDPPASIAEFLRMLPNDNRERLAVIRDRLKSSPEDFWLNRLLLDGLVYERSSTRDTYRKRYAANPESLDNQYLYGRSLVGFDTKEALRIYADILEKDPDYPWVHYSELEIYRSEAFRDRRKLRASFDTLAHVCPGWIEPYRYLTALDDDALAAYASRLRAMLEASNDPRALKLYSTLWSAEFRVRPKAEWDVEKERIATDLRRLREIKGVQTTIAGGAKLIGDDALAKEMTPPPTPDVSSETEAWRRAHPYPGKNDPPEKRRAYAEAQLEASAKWIAMAPERIAGYYERFTALAALDAPAEQIAKAGNDVVKIARTDDRASGPSFIEGVARKYVERGILLDRVPTLIDETLTGIDDPEGVIQVDLAPSEEMTQMNRMDRVSRHVSAIATLSECYQKLGQLERARGVLAPLPAYLATKSVPAGVRDLNSGHNLLVSYALAHYSYWNRLAELDDHDNRREDALKDYREALLVWDVGRDDLLAKQRRLWKDLGRSDEAWQAWVDSIPRPSWRNRGTPLQVEFASVHRVLPKITLKDLDGTEWTADRFNAKTTIAVVWATWCEPCRKELPFLATLAERLKDRSDVQVVSLDMDDNPEVVKSFLDEKGYTFPVLLAKNFAEDLMPYFSIPRTWIIRNGAIQQESEGFAEGDQWVDRTIERVK